MNNIVQANMDASSIPRPVENFRPTIWGDYFLSYTSELTEVTTQEKHELEELKDRIRKLLVETPDDTIQKLDLIDAIQRLGVGYHFANEIETSIQNIFDAWQQSENNIDDNLYVVALRFRLVRQQGHYVSPDVFKQFTYHDGKFKEILTNDVQGLLSLYEAAHMRVHREEILDEALIFATGHLESMATNLSNTLKVQIWESLRYPIQKTVPRVGARKYIDIYENIEGRNDLLLKFAKLDFNMLQKLHQREISELTSWSKDMDFANQFPYAREKTVEGYIWILAMYFEPRYSRARKWLAKLIRLITIIDDTYDSYGTIDELVLLNDAIQRWDISDMDLLPPYLRPLYQAILDVYKEMEEVLAKEGKSDRIYYGKLEMKKLSNSNFKGAEWLNDGYTPTCEEYMKHAIVNTAAMILGTNSLVGMEEVITKDIFDWMLNEPSIVRASCEINRLVDDIFDHKDLKKGRALSIIECYVKEYGASVEEAYVKFQGDINNSWKDLNKALLRPTEAPMFVMERVQNLARAMDTYFQGEDGYTDSFKLRDIITSLLVEPITI